VRTCEEYQEMISASLDDELTAEELTELHAHMASCPDCRLMYDAFCGISGAMADDLAEPPAELLSGVMLKINAANAAGRKKRRVPIRRIAATAACLAVILLGVSQLDLFRMGSADSNNAAPAAAPMDAAADDTASAELRDTDACAPQSGSADSDAAAPEPNYFGIEPGVEEGNFAGKDGAALYENNSPADDNGSPFPPSGAFDATQTTESAAGTLFTGITAAALYSPDAPDVPVSRTTDAAALAELETLLSGAAVFETGMAADPDYLLEVTDVSGSTCTLYLSTADEVWYSDGEHWYLISATPDQFLSLMAP
jgi:hypothetical protein